MSSTYGPRVSDAISGAPVPTDVAHAITDQVGAAMRVAGEIGGEPGRALATAASGGFADGMSIAFMMGSAALALGAVIVALYLPARAHDHEEALVSDGPADGDGRTDGDGRGVDQPVRVSGAAPTGDDTGSASGQDGDVSAPGERTQPVHVRAGAEER